MTGLVGEEVRRGGNLKFVKSLSKDNIIQFLPFLSTVVFSL